MSIDNNVRTEQFLSLYTQCEAPLYAYLLSLLGNRADADEALQETVLVLWRKFDEYEPGTQFTAWAKSIAFHKALHIRRKKRPSNVDDAAFLEAVDQAFRREPDGLRQRIQILESCLDKLPEADREIVTVRYDSKQKLKDYADQMGRPVNTLYKSLERIRRLLVECVQRTLAAETR